MLVKRVNILKCIDVPVPLDMHEKLVGILLPILFNGFMAKTIKLFVANRIEEGYETVEILCYSGFGDYVRTG